MNAFVIFANCSVSYVGRAESTLEDGNYLIIRKNDGSLIIHGSSLLKALNFQPPKSTIQISNNKIISRHKKETITIIINTVLFNHDLAEWSDNRIKLIKTEDDLRNKIIDNIDNIIGKKITSIQKEYRTEYGPIDILATDSNGLNIIIEVKRAKADIKACSQLDRYLKVVQGEGWLLSPAISSGALKYCKEHNLRWKEVNY